MSDDLDEPYRLEDYFCPGCLSARHDLCDGLNYWCTCLCIAEHDDVVRARRALLLPGVRVPLPPEGD